MLPIIDVALNIPLKKTFHYLVPDLLQDKVCIGKRVKVPFGKKENIGFIVDVIKESNFKELKTIIEVIDDEPVIDEPLLKLSQWISEYYICSYGEVLFSMVPQHLKKPKKEGDQLSIKSKEQESWLDLTNEQKYVVDQILMDMQKKEFAAYLLFGITGSGKTEIYMRLIKEVLSQGQGVIFLAPEIALSGQVYDRFMERFPHDVVMMHSKMTAKEKSEAWFSIKQGKKKIVIGPRSSIFAPMPNLGLIIVDEEHEPSYKQEDAPRYHARDVAVMRAKMEHAKIMLGSATPSLESFYNVSQGKYKIFELKKRVKDAGLPKISLIDMRYSPKKMFMISRVLFDKMINCLNKKEQIILFLNRRGSSSMLLCKLCGKTIKCKRCDLALTHHQKDKILLCHYCGYKIREMTKCLSCGGPVDYIGIGTQKLEDEIKKLFPLARVERLDTDSIVKKGECQRILDNFKKEKIDILIGTQMLAKGLDFHNVTLIGIISSDLSLHLPDFRAQERTFQLITQVAGRCGRGQKPGEVVVQSFNPEHDAISHASASKHSEFILKELGNRKMLAYPPFAKMIEIIFKGKNEKSVSNIAQKLYNMILEKNGKNKDIMLLGPSPMPISYMNKQHRWHLLLKSKKFLQMNKIVTEVVLEYKAQKGVKIFVNVDPINMM